jgi:hypothetical protein
MSCARHICGSAMSVGEPAFEAAIIAANVRRKGTLGQVDARISEKQLGLVDILVCSHVVAVHRLILRPAVKRAIDVGTQYNHCWFVTGFGW